MAFLQSWRASIIPILAIPVSLIGTFAVMAALGFSLNNLSLFGLVLAIGIVVDDAIVVVENVERNLAGGPRAAGCDDQGDGRSGRRPHSHRARAERRIHPDGIHQRNLGSVLPAICAHHRGGDAVFRFRLADAQPCPLPRSASASRREAGLVRADLGFRARLVFSPVQSRLRRRHRGATAVSFRLSHAAAPSCSSSMPVCSRSRCSALSRCPPDSSPPRIRATSSSSRNCRRALRFLEQTRSFARSRNLPARWKG